MVSSPCDDRRNVPRQLELHWIGVDARAARASSGPVERGVAPEKRPLFGPSQRASSWFSAVEIQSAPNAAFNISDGGDAIGCAHVAKLSVLGISWINAHASARAVGCRATKIQWAGTLD